MLSNKPEMEKMRLNVIILIVIPIMKLIRTLSEKNKEDIL